MSNKKLFEEAIADARTVREAAVANAKAALEETFTPKIMSMLEKKLSELEEGDLEEEVKEEGYGKTEEGHEAEIGFGTAMQKPQIEEDSYEESSDSLEEMDLDAILAELEEEEGKMEEGEKKDMEEAKKEVEEAKKTDKEKVEESLDEADDDSSEDDGEDEVTELTVDELKDIIRDVLQDVMGGGEEEITGGDETGEEEVGDEGESIDLDELLAELDSMEEGKDKVEEKKEEKGKKVEEAKKKDDDKKVEEAKKEVEEAKKELEEAIKVIKFLKKELNEVNLLNAKNTYVNKIFKEKSLSESQKVNVLKNMDKATNVKEAKVIYESLVSTLTTSKKNSIKESVGFASKASGVAPRQPIVEGDSAVRRMQQLAGIIK